MMPATARMTPTTGGATDASGGRFGDRACARRMRRSCLGAMVTPTRKRPAPITRCAADTPAHLRGLRGEFTPEAAELTG